MSDIIEINDAGLVLSNADGVQLVSPALSVVDGDSIHVGDAARSRSRLDPRKTFDKFWDQLDQQPLNRNAGQARSHADLAWYHLQDIARRAGEGTQLVLAAPHHFGNERLSLALGIAQACKLEVIGLVESQVAMAACVKGNAPRLVLDAGQHRSHATQVEYDDELYITDCRELGKGGIGKVYQLWMNFIAAEFIRETRFDPLHDAASEQHLFDSLPQWIYALSEQNSVALELRAGQRLHHIEISRDQLATAAAAVYEPLVDAARKASGTVILSARLAALPGLQQQLQQHANVVALPETALTEAVLAFHDQIRAAPDELAWVTRLPGPVPDSRHFSSDGEPSDGLPATHLLHHWRALPFKDSPLLLGERLRNLDVGESAHGALLRWVNGGALLDAPDAQTVWLNGKAVTGQHPVRAGDALQLAEGGDLLRLIAVAGN